MNQHTQPPGEAQDAPLHLPTDITPEKLFEALGRLRTEAEAEIERLLIFLDQVDGFSAGELEDQVDDNPCDTDELEPGFCGVIAAGGNMPHQDWLDEAEADDSGVDANDEPSLGSVNGPDDSRIGKRCMGGQEHWAQGAGDEREGDPCCDDREGDELQHGGDEHDGAEPDEDGEPLLGWTEPRERGQQALGDNGTEAEQGSTCPGDLRRGKARYDKRDRSGHQNRDGMHVTTEQGFGSRRRLRNLSDRQREIVKPRLDRDTVVL